MLDKLIANAKESLHLWMNKPFVEQSRDNARHSAIRQIAIAAVGNSDVLHIVLNNPHLATRSAAEYIQQSRMPTVYNLSLVVLQEYIEHLLMQEYRMSGGIQ